MGDWLTLLSLAGMILVANGAPVLATYWLGSFGGGALDRGFRLRDGQPLLGSHKTWRGVAATLLATEFFAWFLGLSFGVGLALAVGAVVGDLASSFLKRRLGLQPGADAPGLDEAAESLFPALIAKWLLGLSWLDVAAAVLAFTAVHFVLVRAWRRFFGSA
jgi:CDP-2,3-bis-(O-geranylgeranyl)-sn-glycerol synthase